MLTGPAQRRAKFIDLATDRTPDGDTAQQPILIPDSPDCDLPRRLQPEPSRTSRPSSPEAIRQAGREPAQITDPLLPHQHFQPRSAASSSRPSESLQSSRPDQSAAPQPHDRPSAQQQAASPSPEAREQPALDKHSQPAPTQPATAPGASRLGSDPAAGQPPMLAQSLHQQSLQTPLRSAGPLAAQSSTSSLSQSGQKRRYALALACHRIGEFRRLVLCAWCLLSHPICCDGLKAALVYLACQADMDCCS